MSVMTDEQRAAHIRALLHELQGYEARGETSRAALVRAQLKAHGHAGAAPAKRATQMKKASKG